MAPIGENGSAKPKSRYVWDPQKLAWVETTEPAPEEAVVEPTRKGDLEDAVAEPTSEEEEEGVLAEGVPFEVKVEAGGLQYRGAWIRLLAFLIDYALLSLIAYGIGRASGEAKSFASEIWLGVGFVYFVGFWSWRGQTIGKMVIGAKIVKTDGRAIGIGRVILRYLFYLIPTFGPILYFSRHQGLVSYLVALLSFIIIAANSKKRGIYDFIAGTCVISTRRKAVKPEILVETESAGASGTSEGPEMPHVAGEAGSSEPDTDKQE